MKETRRSFFRTARAVGAGALAVAGSAKASSGEAAPGEDAGAQSGMLYDATKCVGCKACMSVCKRVNAAAGALSPEAATFDKDALWDAPADLSGNTRTLIKLFKESGRWSYIKYSCMHCLKPSCVSVCPVKAMTKDPVTGAVEYSRDTCIGCRYCQIACPFNIPKFQWDRSIPQIVKCDLCRSTNLKEKGITACAEVCPTGAILFGTRAELLAEAHARLKRDPHRYVPQVYGEHEVGGTNHLYLAALPFKKLGLPELPADAPASFSEHIQHTIYKGFIAPIAMYATLCLIALRNERKNRAHEPAKPASGTEEEKR